MIFVEKKGFIGLAKYKIKTDGLSLVLVGPTQVAAVEVVVCRPVMIVLVHGLYNWGQLPFTQWQ